MVRIIVMDDRARMPWRFFAAMRSARAAG